ncbi:MAG: P27 family phage terminase small subunit [Liquorilactobacillus hordei]|uniref:P27 family phage terminase small subunit n=1 Tax=Liquorilactobacillus hordei TaxID=468911 RepID=UPI0039E93823
MNQKKMREELLSKINSDSQIEIEKVERYCLLVKHFAAIERKVGNDNLVVVKNGSQEYWKVNPGISEMNKINAQLINLGKDMGLSAPPGSIQGDDYGAGDLV